MIQDDFFFLKTLPLFSNGFFVVVVFMLCVLAYSICFWKIIYVKLFDNSRQRWKFYYFCSFFLFILIHSSILDLFQLWYEFLWNISSFFLISINDEKFRKFIAFLKKKELKWMISFVRELFLILLFYPCFCCCCLFVCSQILWIDKNYFSLIMVNRIKKTYNRKKMNKLRERKWNSKYTTSELKSTTTTLKEKFIVIVLPSSYDTF